MVFANLSRLHETNTPLLSCEPHFTICKAPSCLSLHLNLTDIGEVERAGIVPILQMRLKEVK